MFGPQGPGINKQGTLTDRSGSITTGGTAQTLAAVNASRRYLLVQNPLSATTQGIATAESLFINFTTTAVAGEPSIELAPGDIFVMEGSAVSTELVSVIAATTGHKWTAKEM
jgi:archaellin